MNPNSLHSSVAHRRSQARRIQGHEGQAAQQPSACLQPTRSVHPRVSEVDHLSARRCADLADRSPHLGRHKFAMQDCEAGLKLQPDAVKTVSLLLSPSSISIATHPAAGLTLLYRSTSALPSRRDPSRAERVEAVPQGLQPGTGRPPPRDCRQERLRKAQGRGGRRVKDVTQRFSFSPPSSHQIHPSLLPLTLDLSFTTPLMTPLTLPPDRLPQAADGPFGSGPTRARQRGKRLDGRS